MKRKIALSAVLIAAVMLYGCSTATPEENASETVSSSSAASSEATADTENEVPSDVDAQEETETVSQYGEPIETLDEFFSMGTNSGFTNILEAEENSLFTAYNSTKGIYAWYDIDGNIYYESSIGYDSAFVGGRCVMNATNKVSGQKCYILTIQNGGLDIVVPKGLTEGDGNNIIYYGKDSTGYTLWTARRDDTMDGSELVLTAWDNDGNVKMQVSTADALGREFNLDECYTSLLAGERNSRNDLYSKLYHESGPCYTFNVVHKGHNLDLIHYCLNVENGTVTTYYGGQGSHLKAYDDVIIYDDGNATVMNLDFTPKFGGATFKSVSYKDGMLYLFGDNVTEGYYDLNENLVVDTSDDTISGWCGFDDRDVGVMILKNPEGVKFWRLMRRDGTWVNEPQKGSYSRAIGNVFVVDTDTGRHVYDYSGTLCDDAYDGVFVDSDLLSVSLKQIEKTGTYIGTMDFNVGGNYKPHVVVLDDKQNCFDLASYEP